jgi:hypothetical protein
MKKGFALKSDNLHLIVEQPRPHLLYDLKALPQLAAVLVQT